MDSLWRKLEELEIHPLTAAQQEATPETPPQVERPSLPKAAVPRSVAARSTQLDLVSPPQLELAAQKQMPGKAPVDASKERLAAALTYAMVSQLKRTHPGGFFTRDEICKVILAFLQDDGHMGRKDLIGKVITSLEMPEHHEKRIENALETMERDGKIMAGATTVSLIRD